MLTESHQGLENLVLTIATVFTCAGGGWVAYAKQQKEDLLEKIDGLKNQINEHWAADKEGFKIQWAKIDAIKEVAATKVELEEQWNRAYDTLHRSAYKEDLDALRKRVDDVQINYVSRVEFKDDLRNTVTLAITPLKIAIDALAVQLNALALQVAKNGK